MLLRSKSNFSPDGFERLKAILHRYKKVWALKLGSQPPSKLPPMKIELKPGAKPVRPPPRTYSPPQLYFMKKKMVVLESLGLVYRKQSATWASPLHIIPKHGPEKFRLTVYLRVLNSGTVPQKWPTPNLAGVMQNFSGSIFLAASMPCRDIGNWSSTKFRETVNRLSLLSEPTPQREYCMVLPMLSLACKPA